MNPQVEAANDNNSPQTEWGQILKETIVDIESQDVSKEAIWVKISVKDRLFGNIHPCILVQYMEQTRAANDSSIQANDNTAIKEAA